MVQKEHFAVVFLPLRCSDLAAELIGFHASQSVRSHYMWMRRGSDPSQLCRTGRLRSKYAGLLFCRCRMQTAQVQHRTRCVGQEVEHRNKMKHMVHFQNKDSQLNSVVTATLTTTTAHTTSQKVLLHPVCPPSPCCLLILKSPLAMTTYR